jgi:hypothetical protein
MFMGDNIVGLYSSIFLAETQLDRWLKKRNARSHDLTVLRRGRARISICKQANGKIADQCPLS